MQRRNDELVGSLDLVAQFGQPRFLWRLPEFGYVGAGNEGATLANDQDCLAVVLLRGANSTLDSLPHRVREGVDRRVIDRDYTNSGDNFVTDFSIHSTSFSDSIGSSCMAN